MQSRIVLVSSLAVAMTACSFAPSDSERAAGESQRLVNGNTATPDVLTSTIALSTDGASAACTAVRVGPRQILTAAHCVAKKTASGDDTGYSAVPRDEYLPNATVFYTRAGAIASDDPSVFLQAQVAFTSFAPGFQISPCALAPCTIGDVWRSDLPDMALVTLDRDLDASVGTAVIDTQPLMAGEAVTLTGYGCVDVSETAPDPDELRFGVGALLTRDGQIATAWLPQPLGYGSYALTPGASFGDSSSATTPSLCPGDSGGPLYRGAPQAGAPERVIGINSGVTSAGDAAKVNHHTRVENGLAAQSPNVTWLKSLVPQGTFL